MLAFLKSEEREKGLTPVHKKALRKLIKQMANFLLETKQTSRGIERYTHFIVERKVHLTIRKTFFSEVFAKNLHNTSLTEVMAVAIQFNDWMPEARYVRTEVGIHHHCNFDVYNATFNGRTIVFKTKDNGNVYSMRIM